MQTFDQALLQHVQAGRVAMEDAIQAASSPHDFKLLVAGDGRTSTSMSDLHGDSDPDESHDPSTPPHSAPPHAAPPHAAPPQAAPATAAHAAPALPHAVPLHAAPGRAHAASSPRSSSNGRPSAPPPGFAG
jgi:hypothetical protein